MLFVVDKVEHLIGCRTPNFTATVSCGGTETPEGVDQYVTGDELFCRLGEVKFRFYIAKARWKEFAILYGFGVLQDVRGSKLSFMRGKWHSLSKYVEIEDCLTRATFISTSLFTIPYGVLFMHFTPIQFRYTGASARILWDNMIGPHASSGH